MKFSKLSTFAGGVLFGTAGIKILGSKDAKKAYVHFTAAALRAKDETIKQATIIQENCTDIYEEAKRINKARADKEREAVIGESEDKAECTEGAETEPER